MVVVFGSRIAHFLNKLIVSTYKKEKSKLITPCFNIVSVTLLSPNRFIYLFLIQQIMPELVSKSE